MDLLEKASIILTPTAYNNGEALCVKPTDGSGDFDFSRNSAATRVNAQGLVENVQILSSNLVQNGDFSELGSEEVSNGSFSQEGSELVTNGNFDADSDWNKLNATIIGGKGNLDGVGQTSLLWQTILTENKFYKATFTISNYNEIGDAKLINNSGFAYYTINSNGTFTTYFKHTNANGNLLFRATNGAILSIDNVSIKEVGQDWTFGTGWSVGEDKSVSDGSQTGNSLLQQASILTLNKTYKVSYELIVTSGSIYARLGFSGAGVVRTTSGTFVEYIECDGNTNFDFLANSSFEGSVTNISVKEVDPNDYWTLGTGWSIGENAAIAVSGAATKLTQSISGLSGKKCSVTFTLSDYGGSGTVKLDFGTDVGQNVNANGTYTEVGIYDIDRLEFYKNAAFEGSLSNISVIEITDDTNLPRINYEGFSYQDALGSELVTNGGFDTDSDWIKGAAWSIGNGVATYDASGSSSIQSANTSIVLGKIYRLKFEIISSNNARLSFTNNLNQNLFRPNGSTLNNFSNGEYTLYLEAQSNSNALKIFAYNVSGGSNFSIDNVSVKEYLGQEVVPDSGCGSWLFEPQTTQLLPYSEDFSDSTWTKGSTVSIESGYLAPDGNNTAYKVTKTGTAQPYLTRNQSLVATTTRSIYARSVSGTGTATLLSHNSNTNNVFTLTEQWQRFELNNTASPSGVSTFYAADFRGSGTLTEYLVWGANATNDQDYATSYIPSNGTSVTRNSDVCTNGGSLASINSTEGVLYFEGSTLVNGGSNKYISLSNNTSSNRLQVIFHNNSNRLSITMVGAIGSVGAINDLSFVQTNNNKVAVSYSALGLRLFVNGVLVGSNTDNASFTPNTLTTLDFALWNQTTAPFEGNTKCLAVWKEALTDSELQELTTI
jgi:hypothetical protein